LTSTKHRIVDAGIITKMTAVYILAVLVPSLSMAIYSYRESLRLTEQETLSDAAAVFSEIHDQLVSRIEDATYLADQLAYNSRLRIFLANQYEFRAESVLYYRDIVFPIVEYAAVFQPSGVSGIRIFYTNKTIPEFWPYFYREYRAAHLPWYDKFVKSDREGGWFFPSDSAVASEFLDLESQLVFTYARKMYSQTVRYIGMATVDVRREYLFETFRHFADESSRFYLVSDTGVLLHGTGPDSASELPSTAEFSVHRNRILRERGFAYIGRRLPDIDYTMISRIDLREDARVTNPTRFLTPLVIIVSVAVLELISYLALNRLFRRLRQISATMNRAADGDFDTRIPVRNHDEIGQIAQDYNIMIEKINDLVKETIERETTQKDAQLRALQLQINPHFIYNTIDTFRMQLVLDENFELADTLAAFGKMLRYNMSQANVYAPLAEELDYVYKYLSIQSLRYSDRLTLHCAVPEDHKTIRVLKFVLQPIVENSIAHGIGNGEQELSINIRTQVRGGMLEITVHDDGLGISPEKLRDIRERLERGDDRDEDRQIGLLNIQRRLRLYYGSVAGLEIRSVAGVSTDVTIHVPVEARGTA
jgi:sensor histidine kinase YesM